ncbi:unnamed protein product [Leptidea sinapis]|uniref:Uncharacterized protein n=1 Tax=Leptidea sinapis TaxID=189913 RepID=A0A5E4Q3G0_9NEOP|nr:unnamed protein product [Leptidea sinapis]
MAKTHPFQGDKLTENDLIVLYKNIDVGTKLMTEAKASQTRPSNQYVENIVYKDDVESDDSEIGDLNNPDDIRDMFIINSEQIDLFDNNTSINNLSQKFCKVDMRSSTGAKAYDNQFIFKDPFIRDQIRGLLSDTDRYKNDSFLFPSSLLDYICCKRLEDNGDFYMDTIIKYVQNTIEHLKRISNGDYLTDRAKEKWREVNDIAEVTKTVLCNSISIPIRIDRKTNLLCSTKTTWEDGVHSEVDFRYLSKILEKKLVLEIPRIICGSFKLFDQQSNENLIIHCKKESPLGNHKKESGVDVVLKLERSASGKLNKLNSITILQNCTALVPYIENPLKVLTMSSQYENEVNQELADGRVIELDNDGVLTISDGTPESMNSTNYNIYEESIIGIDTDDSISSRYSEERYRTLSGYDTIEYGSRNKLYSDEQTEANLSVLNPDELKCNVESVNQQPLVLEENIIPASSKKSPMRVRIKSPYENSSLLLEEKKRRRLLEIRQHRENKKKLLNEYTKISKHKKGNTAIMAQASNSVTKLSITNKSFYNSIYGQAKNTEKVLNKNQKVNKKDLITVMEQDSCEEVILNRSTTTDAYKEKYINHSYYLDDADTQVQHLQIKQSEMNDSGEACPTSTSVVSRFSNNSIPFKSTINTNSSTTHLRYMEPEDVTLSENNGTKNIANIGRILSPKLDVANITATTTSVECRKSIDKLYNLINTFGKNDERSLEARNMTTQDNSARQDQESINSIIQPSDSGTSIKHRITSSIPSCFSFDKTPNHNASLKNIVKKDENIKVTVAPKVIISSKTQAAKPIEEKGKKDKRSITSPRKVNENPLKAISQLLHKFESVQKSRHKEAPETKENKKVDVPIYSKSYRRQVSFKKPMEADQHTKENETLNRTNSYERRPKLPSPPVQALRYRNTKFFEEKQNDKLNRRKISDIIDEAKEAKGEAIRGPPKFASRIDSLAQPKKSYIQSRHDQYQSRTTKNITQPNKPKIVVNTPIPAATEKSVTQNVRSKQKRTVNEVSNQKFQSSIISRLGSRRSASSSPVRSRKVSPVSAFATSFKYNVPDTPLETKMVAVESYVNNHYGRVSPSTELDLQDRAQTARVPLIPTDIVTGSSPSSPAPEESQTLGTQLHSMIYTLLNGTNAARCDLGRSKNLDVQNFDETFSDNIEQDGDVTSNTEFAIDVSGDKNIATAVSSYNSDFSKIQFGIQPFNSSAELARLETALYRRLSGGNFSKRLRIKNLTLTPKHSLQQNFVLQSGDAGPLMIRSTVSQNFNCISKKGQTVSELNIRTEHSNVDWSFVNCPLQVATVAYALPETSVENILNGMKLVQKTISKHTRSDRKPEVASQNDYINLSEIVNTNFDTSLENNEQNGIQTNEKYTENEDFLAARAEKSNEDNVIKKLHNVTSLDILVGLLNEIKNITSCQTHITQKDGSSYYDRDNIGQNQLMHNETSNQNSSEFIDSQGLLETPPCLNYGSTNASSSNNDYSLCISKPLQADKEVAVDIPALELVHTFTDVPSRFFQSFTNRSICVANSVDSILNEPSHHSSTFSLISSDYETLYSNSTLNKIIELPQKNPSRLQLALKDAVIDKKLVENNTMQLNNFRDADQMLKTKRDILVTVYSLFVLTVFAALSLPEYLQYM